MWCVVKNLCLRGLWKKNPAASASRCDHCDISSSQKNTLWRHNTESEEPVETIDRTSSDANYIDECEGFKCEQCDYIASTKTYVK